MGEVKKKKCLIMNDGCFVATARTCSVKCASWRPHYLATFHSSPLLAINPIKKIPSTAVAPAPSLSACSTPPTTSNDLSAFSRVNNKSIIRSKHELF